jgi:outer membrane lipoprotein
MATKNTNNGRKDMKWYLFIICILLNACSNLPKAIKDPPVNDISYTQAIQNINQYKNAPVRWGGTIVEVENEQNFTLVQVLYYPLDSDGEPEIDKSHGGRFVFKTSEFLDPAVYTKSSEITVAGTLIGDIERAIGNKVMRMPLISATTIYRWPVYVYDSRYDGFGYGYGYNPYYGGYPYYWGNYYWPYASPYYRPAFRYR